MWQRLSAFGRDERGAGLPRFFFKASIEIPSSQGGVVKEIKGKQGSVVLSLEAAGKVSPLFLDSSATPP